MQYSVSFNLRPVKIAYLIDDDDLDTFTEIARFCCTQWGGIHNVIIPVNAMGVPPYFARVLAAHAPDRIVIACTAHATVAREWCTGRFIGITLHAWERYLHEDQVLHPLALYDTAPLFESPRCLSVYHSPDTADSLARACAVAAFGDIWPGQEEVYWRVFSRHLVQLDSRGEEFLKRQMLRDPLASPINVTGTHLSRRYVRGYIDKVHFDVVVGGNTTDLCVFWDQRAVENIVVHAVDDPVRRVLIVPSSLFARAACRHLLLDTIRPLLDRPSVSSTIDVNVLASGKEGRRAYTAMQRSQSAGIARRLDGPVKITTHFGRPPADGTPNRYTSREPLVFVFNNRPLLPEVYRESADVVTLRGVSLSEGANTLYTPQRSITFAAMSEIILDVESEYWDRYPGHPAVARRIVGESRFSHYGLTRHIYSVSHESNHAFDLIPEAQALSTFFESQGYRTRRHATSRQAQALIDLMGGINECQFLRRRDVRHILQRLAVKTTNKLSQDIVGKLLGRLRAEVAAQEHAELAVVRATLSHIDIAIAISRMSATVQDLWGDPVLRASRPNIVPILDHLARRGVIVRGFHVRCDNCGTPTWHSFNAAGETIQCPGCFHTFPLSVMVEAGMERPWEYTLNTAVNRAVDQDALAPVMLLAKIAAERGPIHCQAIGLELTTLSDPNPVGDLDVVFVKQQRVYAGECKMGSELKDKDIRMAERVLEMGCSGFFFASPTGFDERSQGLIDTFKAKAAASIKPFDVVVYNEEDLTIDP